MTKTARVALFLLVAFTAGILLGKRLEPAGSPRRNVGPEDWLVVVRSDPDGPRVVVKNNWMVISRARAPPPGAGRWRARSAPGRTTPRLSPPAPAPAFGVQEVGVHEAGEEHPHPELVGELALSLLRPPKEGGGCRPVGFRDEGAGVGLGRREALLLGGVGEAFVEKVNLVGQ